ncbi:hypothetical protein GF380_06130 [Candidatus Uhrbacteria bacterium]|nr:hypothetical protein [Candidatus Uhrbacteria bacterium]
MRTIKDLVGRVPTPEDYLQQIRENPDNTTTLFQLLSLLKQRGEHGRMIACLGRICLKLTDNRKKLQWRVELAKTYNLVGRYEDAIRIVHIALRGSEYWCEYALVHQARMLRVDALDLLGQTEEAKNRFISTCTYAKQHGLRLRPRLCRSIRESRDLPASYATMSC